MAGRRKGTNAITPLELKVLQVLWSDGSCTVQQVQAALLPSTELAYNTVQTMLNILHRKGRVKRSLDGRAYVYRPSASKDKVAGQAVKDLIQRMFGGSPEELVMSLIKSRQLNLDQIAALKQKMAAEKENPRDE